MKGVDEFATITLLTSRDSRPQLHETASPLPLRSARFEDDMGKQVDGTLVFGLVKSRALHELVAGDKERSALAFSRSLSYLV